MQQITSLVKLESLLEHCLLVSFSLFSLFQSVTVHSNDKDTLSLSISSNHRFCVLFLCFFSAIDVEMNANSLIRDTRRMSEHADDRE